MRGGTVLVVTVVGVAWWAGKTLTGITRRVPFGIAIIVEAMLLKPLFAVRALHEHGALVHVALDATDLHGVRSAVGP